MDVSLNFVYVFCWKYSWVFFVDESGRFSYDSLCIVSFILNKIAHYEANKAAVVGTY